MSEALGQRYCFTTNRRGLFRIAEQPMDDCADAARAHAGVMPAVMPMVIPVSFEIIKPSSDLTVLASCHRFAGEHSGRPSAVVRLQAQFVVHLVRGQLQQLPR